MQALRWHDRPRERVPCLYRNLIFANSLQYPGKKIILGCPGSDGVPDLRNVFSIHGVIVKGKFKREEFNILVSYSYAQ